MFLPTPIFILLLALAVANGARTTFQKGVATLAGSGITRYRTAILWELVAALIASGTYLMSTRLTS